MRDGDGHWFLMVISFPHGKTFQLDSHLLDEDVEPRRIYIKMMVFMTTLLHGNVTRILLINVYLTLIQFHYTPVLI